jgi:hypothetical protein
MALGVFLVGLLRSFQRICFLFGRFLARFQLFSFGLSLLVVYSG